ncbi:hypothetical protein HDU85_007139 [Gaertneriomyces sp. JEL0708]|nr:hypothetical protein HDU85_007139 [Gaertneriomyces sp. JEL0708]
MAAIDSIVLREIVEALGTIYNPLATNEQRRLANNFCESLKEEPQSPLWGHYLARKDNAQPDHIRHFGLSLIENAIRYKWNDGSYSDEDRARLKDVVIDLVKEGTFDILTERTYIKEKVAKLFVDVAKRTWPLQWMDMDVLLRNLYSSSPTTQELVLFIYRDLAEDIFIYEDVVAELRKKELVTAMMAVTFNATVLEDLNAKRGAEVQLEADTLHSPAENTRTDFEILLRMLRANPENEGWLLRWTGAVTELYQQLVEERASGSVERSTVLDRLATATLQTLAVFAQWAMLRAIAESGVVYLALNLLLAESHNIRQAAVECLLVLFSRHIDVLNRGNRTACIWQPLFRDGHLDKMMLAWARAHGQLNFNSINQIEQTVLVSEEQYKFLKRLAQAVVELGSTQIFYRKATELPPMFSIYLAFLITIFEHPSVIVASTSITLLYDILKHDFFKTTSEVAAALPTLLSALGDRLCQNDGHVLSDAGRRYYEIDFDSEDEFKALVDPFRRRILEVVKAATLLMPRDTLSWASARIRSTLNIIPDINNKLYVQTFHGNQAILENVLATVARMPIVQESQVSDGSIITDMMDLAEFILQYQTRDPVFTQSQLDMLVSFSGVLHLNPPLLLRCVERIFTFVTFTMPDEVDFIQRGITIRSETRALRRKAATSLVKIANAMPDALVAVYSTIADAINRLLVSNCLLRLEQNLLLEFLLSIVYFSTTPLDAKSPMFASIINRSIDPLEQQTAGSMGDFRSFLEFTGLRLFAQNIDSLRHSEQEVKVAKPDLLEALNQRSAARGGYLGVIIALASAMKRTLDSKSKSSRTDLTLLWAPYVLRILRVTLAILKNVHLMWDPTLWQQMPAEVRGVLECTPMEKAILAGLEPPEDAEIVGSTVIANQVSALSKWFGLLRDQCYQILGRLTCVGGHFYAVPSLGRLLQDSVFSTTAHIDNRHLKLLVAAVLKPLILKCPAGFNSAVLEPVLPHMFKFVNNRLDRDWAELVKTGIRIKDDEDDESADVTDDILAEKTLRNLTRAFSDLVRCLLAPVPTVGKKKEEPPPAEIQHLRHVFQYPDLVRFLLWDQVVAPELLRAVARLVAYQDTMTSQRTLKVCNSLLPVMVEHSDMRPWLGMDLLKSLLEALHDGYHQESHSDIIALIAEIYTRLRPLSEIPYKTFAGLPGMDPVSLKAFEVNLASKAEKKEQQAVVRAFLHTITGVAVSQMGKKQESFILNVPEKKIMTRPKNGRQDDAESDAASEWFSGLFD